MFSCFYYLNIVISLETWVCEKTFLRGNVYFHVFKPFSFRIAGITLLWVEQWHSTVSNAITSHTWYILLCTKDGGMSSNVSSLLCRIIIPLKPIYLGCNIPFVFWHNAKQFVIILASLMIVHLAKNTYTWWRRCPVKNGSEIFPHIIYFLISYCRLTYTNFSF